MRVDTSPLTDGEDELYSQIWADLEITIIDTLNNIDTESKIV